MAASNLKPALVVLGLACVYPAVLLYRIASNENGIHDLRPSRALVFFLLYLAQLRYHTIPFFTTPLKNLPRPESEHPLLGNLRDFFQRPPWLALPGFVKNVPNDGLILIRGIFQYSHTLIPTTPAAIAEVLTAHPYDYEKPARARRFLSRVLGHGLIVVEGPEHKFQRKNVAPAFSGKVIKELVPLFWSKSLQMVDVIADGGHVGESSQPLPAPTGPSVTPKEPEQQDVEIGDFASRATLDIIGKACFGRDLNTLVNRDDELAQQYEIILNPNKPPFFFLANVFLPVWLLRRLPWKMNQEVQNAAMHLRVVCRKFIAEKKTMLSAEKSESVQPSSDIDILSVLMRNGQITDDGLVDQMLTFLAAGHETTSNALTWLSYLLSIHPDVQEKLRKELRASPLAKLRPEGVTSEMVDSLPYLAAVCNETLRFYPTVPVTSRMAIRETQILGQKIPKGTEVILCPWAINRQPTTWGEDADVFNPDRWLDGVREHSMTGFNFITFIHGPRSCIGQGFARSEMKCLVAAMVLKFDLKLMDPDYVPQLGGMVTVKPRKGMWLRLTPLSA